MNRRFFFAALLSIALALSPTAAKAFGSSDISGQHTNIVATPLASGLYLVQVIFDLDAWPAEHTYIIRHACPPGVKMSSQGFSVVAHPSGAPLGGLRTRLRITNFRNFLEADGAHAFSWYIQNDGAATPGGVRLEVSFTAEFPN